jgi:acetyl esterase/lipase
MRISRLISVVLVCLLNFVSFTAQDKPFEIWPLGRMAGEGAKEAETGMAARPDGVVRITNVSTPTLDIFPAAKKNSAAVIITPGGGYSYLSYSKEGTDVAKWLNANGITAVVLKYRVPNNRPGAFQDIQRAIRIARANASKWNIDKKRLGVMGFSAGGHVSTRASTDFDNAMYAAIDSIDKQNARPDFAILVYPAYLEKDGKIVPEVNVRARIPPTLIVVAEDDKTYVNSSKVYHAELNAAKIPNKLLLYPDGGHGFGLISNKTAKAWPEAALAWMREMKILK